MHTLFELQPGAIQIRYFQINISPNLQYTFRVVIFVAIFLYIAK